jgi:hypothetical protein
MATLVLTTVGTLVGGPLGGMIGSLVGQAVDARLFAPKGREGPRIADLRVQTSSYGAAIPRLYGRMRVSGTVIWSTDLIEHRHKQSQGKGRGSATSYSYSVSLAVALSSRPLLAIGRIWADGNLLRGAAGDFKSAATLRLHSGGEDQPVDPLIASAEGVADCPAYRGLAYAVLEEMDLTPFGNRIPSLTFEVVADEAALTLADPLADLLPGAVIAPGAAGDQAAIAGCALGGASRAAAVAPLLPVAPVDPLPGGGWRIGRDGAPPTLLTEPMDDGAGEASRRGQRRRAAAASRPRRITLSAYDPARDYQVGVQAAAVPGGDGEEEALALPCALAADAALALARGRARDAALRADTTIWPQGFAALAVPPGAQALLPGGGRVRDVEERRIEGAAVRLTLRDATDGAIIAAPAAGGRVLATPDDPVGESVAALFDLPALEAADWTAGRLILAAAGQGAGWRGAGVTLRVAEGAGEQALGRIGPAAVLGRVDSVAGTGCPGVIDRASSITVRLLHGAMLLHDADDAALLAGANLAAAGGELVQFGHAAPLGDNRWRLTTLLRGRMGSEDAIAALAPGDAFVLLDDPALLRLPASVGVATVGVGALVAVEGLADAAPLILPVTAAGRATRPLAPAHLIAEGGGWGLALRWVRRSRGGFGWDDGIDASLDEAQERYRVTLTGGGHRFDAETTAPALSLDAATLAPFLGATATVAVAQIGAAGASPAAVLRLAL